MPSAPEAQTERPPDRRTPAELAHAAVVALGKDATRAEKERTYSRAYHAARRAQGFERTLSADERRAKAGYTGGVHRPGRPPRWSTEQIAEALAKTGGLIGVSADLLGCNRRTVERYVARYPSLQKVLADAKEEALDHAEWALYKAAKAGEPWAVQWFLKHQGKRRGYQEVHKTEQDSRVHVDVTYTHDALSSGRPSTTVTPLPKPAEADDLPRLEVVEAEVTYPVGAEGG